MCKPKASTVQKKAPPETPSKIAKVDSGGTDKEKTAEKDKTVEKPVENEKSVEKEKTAEKEKSAKTQPAPAAPVESSVSRKAKQAAGQVTRFVQRALDMGVAALRDEYRGLAKWTAEGMTVEAFKAAQADNKNRYQDVPCGDARRVTLKWPGCPTEYIHANYVKTPNAENRFICTQGPLENTLQEFWTMIVQENVETIVMLCNLQEQGKVKCHKYFPMEQGETMTVADFTITSMEVRPMCPEEPSVRLSVLSLKFKNNDKEETREVRHYHWTDWPDRGVPPVRLTAMELLSRIRGTKKPIVVHCSAGIGRTGTIVAIEYTLERLYHGLECVDMNKLLMELREQRAWSIQNDLQYLYIHRILLFYFLEKYKDQNKSILTPENQEKYKKFVEDYEKATT